MVGVNVAGRDIAVYTVGKAVCAIDNICTHAPARLCDGYLDGHEIECSLHQGKFDVRDGRPLCEPVTEPARSYPVKLEGRRVYVHIDRSAAISYRRCRAREHRWIVSSGRTRMTLRTLRATALACTLAGTTKDTIPPGAEPNPTRVRHNGPAE